MFCDACGARLEAPASYCPSCGRPVGGGVRLMPSQGRIAGHIRVLGILWLVMSAFHLLPGLALFSIFGGNNWLFPGGVPLFVHGLLRILGVVFIAGGVLGLVAGWGLLDRQPWARMLAIVLGCFNLIRPPFGTALGIYTLWVLLPAESEHEYRQSARAA